MRYERVQRKDQAEAAAPAAQPVQMDRRGQSGALAPDAQPGYAEQSAALAPVQAKGQAAGDVHKLAAQGTRGGGGALPHAEQIQASFGAHDVSGVRAHTGSAAAQATKAMGANAYATGSDVAFRGTPDLHTAAHEAAHVVQQRAGVSLSGGVGKVGDAYERHADAVADKVVKGESAEGVLGQMAGGAKAAGVQKQSDGAVQMEQLRRKKVSGTAMGRITKAREAIDHTKQVISFGAGNQKEALQGTNFNSYFRMKAMRDPNCWEIAASVRPIASKYPQALTAAKADLAAGGNCGEHAQVAFDFLRVNDPGTAINQSSVEGLDHAFVLMGDVQSDGDEELVVCDPWPSAATATTWGDHFAHTSDRAKINVRSTAQGDPTAAKEVIAAGLKLSAYGLRMIEATFDDERTKDELDKGTEGDHPWIWQHPDAAARWSKHDYYSESETGG